MSIKMTIQNDENILFNLKIQLITIYIIINKNLESYS